MSQVGYPHPHSHPHNSTLFKSDNKHDMDHSTGSSPSQPAPKCWDETEVHTMLRWLRPHKNRRRYANGLKANCCRELSEKILPNKRPKQIRNKLEYMIREYQRARQVMKAYARKRALRKSQGALGPLSAIPDPLEAARKSCAFFDELDDIFGNDPEVVTDDESESPTRASMDVGMSPASTIRRPASLSPSMGAATMHSSHEQLTSSGLPNGLARASSVQAQGGSGISLPPIHALTSSTPVEKSVSSGYSPNHNNSNLSRGESTAWHTGTSPATGLPDLAIFASAVDSIRSSSLRSKTLPNSSPYSSSPSSTHSTREPQRSTPRSYPMTSTPELAYRTEPPAPFYHAPLSRHHTPSPAMPYAAVPASRPGCGLDTLATLSTSPQSPTTLLAAHDKQMATMEYIDGVQRQLQVNYQRIYDLVQEQNATNKAFLQTITRQQEEFVNTLKSTLDSWQASNQAVAKRE
ncbi:hypothetical protein H4R34_002518 [Dimargaris verticillata]|uniref:Uncharacterized protein n=1 Tax=Dimargaris verticillata TaxID=2761393 RepID=A0A9W8B9B0_9FUNG|nr:hypothetical protein H4R34_002518 [Dimargaris verticillata]